MKYPTITKQNALGDFGSYRTWKVRGSIVEAMTVDANRIRSEFDNARLKSQWSFIEQSVVSRL